MKIVQRMFKLLESGKVHVVLDSIEEWGLCEYENKELIIRSSLSEKNKVRTLIHECAHYLFPELSEKTVLCIEADLYKKITKEEYKYFVFFLD